MAEETKTPDKALAAAGATEETSDESAVSKTGAPAPAAPPNAPPEKPADPPADSQPEDPPEETPAETPEETKDDKELDTDTWGTTGDEVGDSVLAMLQNADLSVEDAKALMYDAMQAGDVTKIDRAALEAKIGKARTNLVMAGAENFVARTQARTQTILTEVHTAVGGEENWTALSAWAGKNVSAENLADYRDLVDQGGAKARFAAQDLLRQYNADSKNTTLGTPAEVLPDGTAPSTGRAISKADYFAELSDATRRGATPAVINEIQQARNRGRKAGL